MFVTAKRSLTAAMTAAVLAAALSAAPAEARNGRNAALAAGVVGGLALGALALGAQRRQSYDDGYYHHPAYYPAYNPGYEESSCYWEKRPIYDYWGNLSGYKRARICN